MPTHPNRGDFDWASTRGRLDNFENHWKRGYGIVALLAKVAEKDVCDNWVFEGMGDWQKMRHGL